MAAKEQRTDWNDGSGSDCLIRLSSLPFRSKDNSSRSLAGEKNRKVFSLFVLFKTDNTNVGKLIYIYCSTKVLSPVVDTSLATICLPLLIGQIKKVTGQLSQSLILLSNNTTAPVT